MKEMLKEINLDFRIINPHLVKEDIYKEYYAKKQELHYSCELENQQGLLLTDNMFEGKIKSVVVLFMPYLRKCDFNYKGNIAKYARGEDYHIKAKEILEMIILKLDIKYPYNKFHFQCDTGIINERFYAGASGLGFIGQNGSIIHEKYGSYGNLMLIYSDMETEEYKTNIKYCLKCNKCQKACPSNAIKDFGLNNSKKCISYLTQKKTELEKDEIELIKNNGYVFGCDICQDVCPLNEKVDFIKGKDEHTNILELKDLENISNKNFKRKYKEKAFSWRGKAVLLRNIKIIKGLSQI